VREQPFRALNPLLARVRSLGALAEEPLALARLLPRRRPAARWVDDTIAAHKIERVLVFCSAMAQYADSTAGAPRGRLLRRRFRQMAPVRRAEILADELAVPLRSAQLLRYERQVARDYDASLFVSAPEAALFRTLAPESSAKIGHFSNGVDTDYFSPERQHANPYAAGERALVFTGAMDYWPNVDAVNGSPPRCSRAAPAFPTLRFYIVGSRPAPAVLALAQLPTASS
jgi:glycosyltransferase involved in cell wall biosynthesis